MHILSTILFALALIHTFSTKALHHLSHRFRKKSFARTFFQLISEVELVFGIWATILLLSIAATYGLSTTRDFVKSLSFVEPLFVFAIMTVAATRPILTFSRTVLQKTAKCIPLPFETSFLFTTLTLGPLLGSVITEPAAMTVTALLLRDTYFTPNLSDRFKYLALGTLFVGISIGGALTPYAAPPILMVSSPWNWDLKFMMVNFGWKVILAVGLGALLVTRQFSSEVRKLQRHSPSSQSLNFLLKAKDVPEDELSKREMSGQSPPWLQALHLLFLGGVVAAAHHPLLLLATFAGFLFLFSITRRHQSPLQIKSSGLVAFFLAGLVVLAANQQWWLEPLLRALSPTPLFLGTTFLTAVTDNATLTYLGSKIPHLSDALKYALVSGAIAGGGLTVIANAPNPAGYAILNPHFGEDGISPLGLLKGAALPTLIAMICLACLPNF